MALQAELVLDSMAPQQRWPSNQRSAVSSRPFNKKPPMSLLAPPAEVVVGAAPVVPAMDADSETAPLARASQGSELPRVDAFGTADAALGRSMRSRELRNLTEQHGSSSRPGAKEGQSSGLDGQLPGGTHAIPRRGEPLQYLAPIAMPKPRPSPRRRRTNPSGPVSDGRAVRIQACGSDRTPRRRRTQS